MTKCRLRFCNEEICKELHSYLCIRHENEEYDAMYVKEVGDET